MDFVKSGTCSEKKNVWDGTHLCSRPCMFRSEAVGTQPTDRPLPGNKPGTTALTTTEQQPCQQQVSHSGQQDEVSRLKQYFGSAMFNADPDPGPAYQVTVDPDPVPDTLDPR